MSKILTIKEGWELYMELTKIKNASYIQRTETQKAYYAGCANILLVLRDQLSLIEDEMEGVMELQKLLDETDDFWKKLATKNNAPS